MDRGGRGWMPVIKDVESVSREVPLRPTKSETPDANLLHTLFCQRMNEQTRDLALKASTEAVKSTTGALTCGGGEIQYHTHRKRRIVSAATFLHP
jgi:hypothetical protein